MSKKITIGILGAMLLVLLIGCLAHVLTGQQEKQAADTDPVVRQLFAMDTVMTFTAYGEEAEAVVQAAMEEVERLDALLSTGSSSSEISQINAAGGGSLSADTAAILTEALTLYQDTDGLFDCSIYPLMQLWGFPTQEYHVPTEEELAQTLALVDASRLQLEDDGSGVTLGEGQQIDLGGIAKGYTSARVMAIYEEYGITSGMVSLGGNVQTLHTKPDGSAWRIGIQDPDKTAGEILAVVEVENEAVITSGGYERYFEEDGETYIHILDPRTGRPADSGLTSVTIISPDGMLADGLSTSLYIMGLDEAADYWREHADSFEMVLVTGDGTLHVTEGIADRLSTEAKTEVLTR